MNRIDNTHATFLNCLRDWNDPFLNGHGLSNTSYHHSTPFSLSTTKSPHRAGKNVSCNRCESCACRALAQTTATSTPHLPLSSHHNHHIPLHTSHLDLIRKVNDYKKSIQDNQKSMGANQFQYQSIVRCKSSYNMPISIDSCIRKLCKTRPKTCSVAPIVTGRNNAAEVMVDREENKKSTTNRNSRRCVYSNKLKNNATQNKHLKSEMGDGFNEVNSDVSNSSKLSAISLDEILTSDSIEFMVNKENEIIKKHQQENLNEHPTRVDKVDPSSKRIEKKGNF